METWTSFGDNEWLRLGKARDVKPSGHGNPDHLSVPVEGRPREARFVKVKIESPQIIPEGYLFSDTDAWIFIDEVLVGGTSE